jgi:hypothetical protein
MNATWYSNCVRQGFANIGGPHLKYFSARELVRRFKDQGAELIYLDGIHQNEVLYPTKLSVHAPILEGRDMMAEFMAACKEFDVHPGAYITPFEHTPLSRGHWDWSQTTTDGKQNPGPEWAHGDPYWACWNSPFLDKMCELIRELYTGYDLEAAFFDGLLSRHGVCHCPSCATKFKADTGHDLPGKHDNADPVFREYRHWKDRTLTDACTLLVAATRVRNPNVQPVSNAPAAWCNWCAVQPVSFFDATEWVNCEVFPGFMDLKRGGYIHPSSVATMAYSIAYTRGQSRGFPKVLSYNYLGSTNFSTDLDTLLELKSTISMGGLACVAGYRAANKPAFEYIRQCEPYLQDTKPVLWSAMLASQESCNTQHDPSSVGEAYFEDLNGAYQTMLDLRLPVEFVSDRDVLEIPTSPYSVMVLTDVGYLTAAQADAVRQFVRKGGGLVATHKTGLVGEDGKPLADFALADVLGVNAAPDPNWQAAGGYMQDPSTGALCFEGEPWWGDAGQRVWGSEYDAVPEEWPWGKSGQGHVVTSSWQPVTAVKSAKVHAWIKSVVNLSAPAMPGIVENRFGAGRAIYIAPRLGEMYARYPYASWRRLMQKALDRVAPAPAPVEVKAPLCVSAYAWEQPQNNRWVIHLLNDLDEAGRTRGRMGGGKNDFPGSRPREGTIPVEGIDVTIRKAGAKRAYLPLENQELPVRQVKGGIKVRIRRMDQHTMVVVE